MTTRRLGFIMTVAALAVCWAAAASESAQKCKSKNPKQDFPATGQTTSYRADDDGDIQAGATLSYTDNRDGTITDNNTCLVWEKKSDDGSIHDKDSVYTWDNAFDVHVAMLNATNFAGYNDWRVPNVKELQSIVNYENFDPAVSPEFNNACTPGCNGLNCSCTTGSVEYWSSSTKAFVPDPWVVDFSDGSVPSGPKGRGTGHVRAVRGGSNLGSSH
ncbi:MAG: hypothetical protein DMD98_02895 [Candidatus Rokuibacteriota bacterium]|nr:MAG: hypothetical protein AUH14_07430 [Candidatus Rokubacteria bacterium 13_2_20CM_69_15_1]PYN38932.1 MAG: hypothetical protein DMD98_02895 [Candidatus Rokubacteria bacterium]